MLKDLLMKRGVRLLQDERVKKLMEDPRVMEGMMGALRLRGRIQESVDARVGEIAHSLNLATKSEMRELKRSLRKMEQDLARAKRAEAAATAHAEV